MVSARGQVEVSVEPGGGDACCDGLSSLIVHPSCQPIQQPRSIALDEGVFVAAEADSTDPPTRANAGLKRLGHRVVHRLRLWVRFSKGKLKGEPVTGSWGAGQWRGEPTGAQGLTRTCIHRCYSHLETLCRVARRNLRVTAPSAYAGDPRPSRREGQGESELALGEHRSRRFSCSRRRQHLGYHSRGIGCQDARAPS